LRKLSLLTDKNVEIEEKENVAENSEQNANLGDICVVGDEEEVLDELKSLSKI